MRHVWHRIALGLMVLWVELVVTGLRTKASTGLALVSYRAEQFTSVRAKRRVFGSEDPFEADRTSDRAGAAQE